MRVRCHWYEMKKPQNYYVTCDIFLSTRKFSPLHITIIRWMKITLLKLAQESCRKKMKLKNAFQFKTVRICVQIYRKLRIFFCSHRFTSSHILMRIHEIERKNYGAVTHTHFFCSVLFFLFCFVNCTISK